MIKRRLLICVVFAVIVVGAVPSWGAKFKGQPARSAISDEDFVKLCQFGTPQEIRTAIKSRGANVNATETIMLEIEGKKYANKVSALMSACYGNNTKAVNLLIRSGADISTRVDVNTLFDIRGYSKIYLTDRADVLCFASAFSKKPEIIKMLIEAGAYVNSRMEDGMTPLIWAAKEGNSSIIVKTLINAGANVNARNVVGMTPLKFASGLNGRLEMVKMLIEAGADINAGEGDRSALMQAAMCSNDPEIVKTLIKAGANVNAKGEDSMTALMYAAYSTKIPEIVNILIEAGADDALDEKGRSALIWAAKCNDNPEIVEALIEAGSYVNIKDKEGNTPLSLARSRILDNEAKRKVIEILIQAGASE